MSYSGVYSLSIESLKDAVDMCINKPGYSVVIFFPTSTQKNAFFRSSAKYMTQEADVRRDNTHETLIAYRNLSYIRLVCHAENRRATRANRVLLCDGFDEITIWSLSRCYVPYKEANNY